MDHGFGYPPFAVVTQAVHQARRPTDYSKCCACGAAGAPDTGRHTYVHNNRSYAAIVVVSVDSGGWTFVWLTRARGERRARCSIRRTSWSPPLRDLCLIQIRVRIINCFELHAGIGRRGPPQQNALLAQAAHDLIFDRTHMADGVNETTLETLRSSGP